MTADFTGLGRPVIDCDIHNAVASLEILVPYLEDHWGAYIRESHFRGPSANDYPGGAPTSARQGTRPANGPPGSDLRTDTKTGTRSLGCRSGNFDVWLLGTKRAQRRPRGVSCHGGQPVAN